MFKTVESRISFEKALGVEQFGEELQVGKIEQKPTDQTRYLPAQIVSCDILLETNSEFLWLAEAFLLAKYTQHKIHHYNS